MEDPRPPGPFPRPATEIEFLLLIGRVCSDRPADHKEAFNITEPQNDQCVSFSHCNNNDNDNGDGDGDGDGNDVNASGWYQSGIIRYPVRYQS